MPELTVSTPRIWAFEGNRTPILLWKLHGDCLFRQRSVLSSMMRPPEFVQLAPAVSDCVSGWVPRRMVKVLVGSGADMVISDVSQIDYRFVAAAGIDYRFVAAAGIDYRQS